MGKILRLLFPAIVICISAHAQKAFIDGSPLSVVNATTRTVSSSIGHAGNFDGMALSYDGTKLFTYNETLKRLYIADVATNALLDSVTFTTFMGDFLPGPGNTFYYTDNPTTRIYKMDWVTKAKVDSSATFSSGTANLFDRPGTTDIWCTIDNNMHTFTQTSMALTAIPTGVPSSQYIQGRLRFNASGTKAYYFSKPSGQSGKLYQMNAATKALEDSLVTPDVFGGLKTLTIASGDTKLYIAYWGLYPNEPSKIYIANPAMDLIDSVNTPHKPFDMVERPGTQELWVVYHYDAKVGVLNTAANLASIDSVTVGTSPKGIIFIPISTSVQAITASSNNYNVYPNPSNGMYTLTTTNTTPASYIITDITGRSIQSGSITGAATINITNANPGIYLLQLNEGNRVQHIKLVKE